MEERPGSVVNFTCVDVLKAAGHSEGIRKGSEIYFAAPYRKDNNPSLRVNVPKDLWRDDPADKGGNAWALAAEIAGCNADDKPAVLRWITEHGLSNGNGLGPVVATYRYRDATGKHVYDVLRYMPKTFRPRQLDGTLSLDSEQRELYCLPELLSTDAHIFFCEGEKDVDNVRALGLTATTSGSSKSWLDRFAAYFKSKHVTILSDNDDEGRRYARTVAASIQPLAASVKILELAGLPPNGDVSDWLKGKDPVDAAEELSVLAEQAPDWAPETAEAPEAARPQSHGFPLDLVIPASTLLAMPIPEREDIVSGLLHRSALGMLVGPRGVGKTRLIMSACDAITRGQPWLAWGVPEPRRVLFCDGELPAVDLLGIVRDICGPSPSPLLDIISSEFFYRQEQMVFTLNSVEHQRRFLLMLQALDAAQRRPELIVFDNLSAMSYGTEENSNSEQDSLLRFLLELRHNGYTVLLLHHTGRNNESRGATRKEDPLDLIIKLEVDDGVPRQNARFTLKFSKMRRKMPTPAAIECELLPGDDGRLIWGWSTVDSEPEKWVQCLRLVQNSKTQDDIARILDVNKSTVSRHLKSARDKKLLDGMTLTSSGRRYLDAIYGGES